MLENIKIQNIYGFIISNLLGGKSCIVFRILDTLLTGFGRFSNVNTLSLETTYSHLFIASEC